MEKKLNETYDSQWSAWFQRSIKCFGICSGYIFKYEERGG